MAYRLEKTQNGYDIVIDNFDKGIADSPYEGFADMRNVNLITSPKQANVMFANAAVTLPPSGYTGVAFTAATTDIFTTATTSGFYNGMALTIVTVSDATKGIVAGDIFYVGDLTATTFKLYKNVRLGTVIDITGAISGTFTVQTFGTPVDSVNSVDPTLGSNENGNLAWTFIMTTNGLVWSLSPREYTGTGGTVAINTLQWLGNSGHSSQGSPNTGLIVFQDYILAFMDADIDYLALSRLRSGAQNPHSSWVYGWESVTSSSWGHRAISATDNAAYFCNDDFIGSITVVAGEIFDPTDTATYVHNEFALALPDNDSATCIAQLGVNLLIGGIQSFIYPWDRVSTSFTYPLIVPENYTKCIVSTNTNAYIFSGTKGNIYITNGTNIDLYKKFPDYLSGINEPYYEWGWALYRKNNLYFTIAARTNDRTVVSGLAGIWAYNLFTDALRMTNSLSYGTYAGTVPVLLPMGQPAPTGDGLFAGWLNTTGGIDYTSGSPYTNYEARIDSDIMPVGTFLTKTTFTNLEFKLSKPLVSGEGIKIYQRSNLNDSFTLIGSTTEVGAISDVYKVNFEKVQWLQLRIELASTATTPSYVPLTEVRIRY